MSEPTKYFVGVDLHKTILQVCVLDRDGEVLKERRFRGGSLEDGLAAVKWLGQWKEGGRFCVEALGMNRWFVNACHELGLRVTVVDATKMGLRMLGKKTDRRDAYELARRLRLGDVDQNLTTYFACEAEFAGRKLVRTRHALTQLHRLTLLGHCVVSPKRRMDRSDISPLTRTEGVPIDGGC